MIERIVLVKLKPDLGTPAIRREVAEYSLDVLKPLPGVVDVHVGTAADNDSAADWDVLLTVRFASAADLEPYRVHPDHRAYVDGYLVPRMAAIEAFNFVVD